MRRQRGLTLAETIIALIIFFLMLAAIGAFAGPMMSWPSAGSAKTDTVASAAYGLDEIERDIRQSDVTLGIWSCVVSVTVTCSQPTSLTVSAYTAVLVAYNAGGVFQPMSDGTPNWQAFIVYSKPPGKNMIYRTYEKFNSWPVTWQAGAAAAVSDAATLPAGTTVAMPNAQSVSIAENLGAGELTLQLVTAAGTGTTTNSTTYNTTILARN
jgi:hypothetical protein